MKSSSFITGMEKSKPLRWLNVRSILSLFLCSTIGASLVGAPLVVYADDIDDQAFQVSTDALTAFLYWSKSLGFEYTYYDTAYNETGYTIQAGNATFYQNGSGGSGTTYTNNQQILISGRQGVNRAYYRYLTGQVRGTYSGDYRKTLINNTGPDGQSYGDYAFVFLLRENLSPANYTIYDTGGNVTNEVLDIKLSGWSYLDTSGSSVDGYRLCYIVFPDMAFRSVVFNNFVNKTIRVIPVYNGRINTMPDEVRRLVNEKSELETAIENQTEQIIYAIQEGNEASETIIDNNLVVQNEFDSVNNTYHTAETELNNNLDSASQNINTTNNLYSNSKFIASANWVKAQFERIVLNTPFELIIMYSLILGIALIFAGKIR